MNRTLISEDKLLELKDLALKIENIEIELTCFGNKDMLILKQRKLTEQLTELIKTFYNMEDLLNFKQAQIEALQKKLQEMQTELDTAKELLRNIIKDYEVNH